MWKFSLPLLYFAARLDTEEYRARNLRLAIVLSRYFRIYLPQKDGGLMVDLVAAGMSVEKAHEIVFRRDVEALWKCHIVLCIFDGAPVDSGVSWEQGFGYPTGKECFAARFDGVKPLPTGENPMLQQSLEQKFAFVSETELLDWAHHYRLSIMSRIRMTLASTFLRMVLRNR